MSCCISGPEWLISQPFLDIFLHPQASSNPSNITNPCYPEGFNTTMMASAIYETPCTKKPQNYNPNQELFMVGNGDSDVCETLVKSIFDFKSCSSSQCSFNGVEQPPVSGDFLVIKMKHSGGERHGWAEAVTVSTVPARRMLDTSLWRGRWGSTTLQRWRSSTVLSGSSVKHTGKL